MKLAVSNIAWKAEDDDKVYALMKECGFTGLEIAPTRIIPESPYEKLAEAAEWADGLKKEHGFAVPSMQSIWYGRKEALFGSREDRKALLDYTKKAVDFAQVIGCKNLVFGCPRNRNMPDDADPETAVSFFKELGDYAFEHETVLAMEANPPIYNTNYINDTKAALELINEVGSEGFLLNLDVGTMIENNESLGILEGNGHLINHVHISEPGLKEVAERDRHKDLLKFLSEFGYEKYVSIETGRVDDISILERMMRYVSSLV